MDAQDRGWGGRVAAMALLAATGVAIIYVPQPIQTLVAREFGITGAAVSAGSIAVQAGYAAGVILLVSLGDRLPARRQVTGQLIATAIALATAAASPSFPIVVVLLFIAGASATIGQILVSAALRLAPPEARARTAAVILGSIVVGLFVVRTALGAVAELLGWRGALVLCAIAVLALMPLSLRQSPAEAPEHPPSYRTILASIPRIAYTSRALRLMASIHVLCFTAFIVMWSMTTVHAVDDLGLGVADAALIGLAGLFGGALTVAVARSHSRIGARLSLTIWISVALGGVAVVTISPGSLIALSIGLGMLSTGMSSEQVSTQAVALASVEPSASGRANTVFMAATFLGGSLGTAVASLLVDRVGFAGVGALATLLVLAAAALAVVAARRGLLS